MKQHRMAALAAAAALAITSTVIAVPVQAAPEELMNSTFEDGYGAWKGVGSTISITSDYHCATADARYRIGNADHNASQYVLKQIHNLFLLILSQ